MKSKLLETLKDAPDSPGCYLFMDSDSQVLYVGKAKNIRRRIQAYRRPGADGRRRLAKLWEVAQSVEFRITENEREALLLEDLLIKRFQPPLNVLLKDDKSFLYLTIPSGHEFPPIRLARKASKLGVSFGPYPSARATRETKRLLKLAFGLRDCSDATLANRTRPCLQKEIGLCLGPCVESLDSGAYEAAVQGTKNVLAGKVATIIQKEEVVMAEASSCQEYETALHARNRVRALEKLKDPQRIRATGKGDFDVFGLDVRGALSILEYRGGDWVNTRQGRVPFFQSPSHAVEVALLGAYRQEVDIPPEIVVSHLPESPQSLEAWLANKKGGAVTLICPQKGLRRRLIRLAESNAQAIKNQDRTHSWLEISEGLGKLFGGQEPRVVDCIDVSHTQGKETVASRVRFVEGKQELSSWRRYSLAGKVANDDYEAMKWVLSKVEKSAAKDGWADWIVLDGGPLQIKAGEQGLHKKNFTPPLFALAKSRQGYSASVAKERIYKSGIEEPVFLIPDSPERLFLEHVRNEAHRFAVSYHRKKRDKVQLQLEKIPGIGPVKARELLRWCQGDLNKIRMSPTETLVEIPGVTSKLASDLQRHLGRGEV